jgi:hypothetical protein
MTALLNVTDKLPRKDFSIITQLGLKALSLALTHATALAPRLPEDVVAGLSADLETLGAVVPGARQARLEARSATTTQNTALDQGFTRVRQIRAAVRRAKAPVAVKHAYGVGQNANPRIVRDVKAAMKQILDRERDAGDMRSQTWVPHTNASTSETARCGSVPDSRSRPRICINRSLWSTP